VTDIARITPPAATPAARCSQKSTARTRGQTPRAGRRSPAAAGGAPGASSACQVASAGRASRVAATGGGRRARGARSARGAGSGGHEGGGVRPHARGRSGRPAARARGGGRAQGVGQCRRVNRDCGPCGGRTAPRAGYHPSGHGPTRPVVARGPPSVPRRMPRRPPDATLDLFDPPAAPAGRRRRPPAPASADGPPGARLLRVGRIYLEPGVADYAAAARSSPASPTRSASRCRRTGTSPGCTATRGS
jgi:hypothetical protein